MLTVTPVTLEGPNVRLEPLTDEHTDALAAVGLDPSLWQWQPRKIATVAEMREYVREALEQQREGRSLPFAIVRRADAKVVGSTRYMDIARDHDRLEIGATWLAPEAQRTTINTEAKFLLLRHAFEVLKAVRVVFKTEMVNERSRAAILRIGAIEEGIFRKHLSALDGRRRDMVYYSIVDSDWPRVKAAFQIRHGGGPVIRAVTLADAQACLDIYRPVVESTTVSFEEAVPDTEEFACRIASIVGEYPWLVAEQDGVVRGYAYAHRLRERSAYRYSVEVSVYVAESGRGRGIGRALYERLFDELRVRGFHRAFAGVALPNDASVVLHQRCGFEQIGIFKEIGRKFDRWIDVAWWQRPI